MISVELRFLVTIFIVMFMSYAVDYINQKRLEAGKQVIRIRRQRKEMRTRTTNTWAAHSRLGVIPVGNDIVAAFG